jgi:superfamily II DNA/RNA helicase
MQTKFFTNTDVNTLYNKFKGIFENNINIEAFDAMVGYFRSSGYFKVRPYLDNVSKVRILVGIEVDNLIARFNNQGLMFLPDADVTISEFIEKTRDDIKNASYQKDVEEGILQLLKDIIDKKVEIRIHPSKTLHAKIYIFRPEGWNEHKTGVVITGSSNFTDNGLGTSNEYNYEFNVKLQEFNDVKFATDEFEKLWVEGVPVTEKDLKETIENTHLEEGITPFELYIKLLIEYFGKNADYDPDLLMNLPKGFKKLSYQVDAVNQGFEILQKHNGFFLSDVVGLGKTVVGTLIINKFFYTNGFPAYISKTLIVVPPALRDNWKDTLEKFGIHNFDIITNGSLDNVTNPEQYDLIIVDEAHKFRNDTSIAYGQLQKICKSRTRRKLEDGSFARKKVILISATPLNNKPTDIANQVYLFQDSKNSSLDISNLEHFFSGHSEKYKILTKNSNIKEVLNQIKKIYDELRSLIIEPLTIRRTRADLKAHSLYNDDLINQGIIFPDIQKPFKILYQLDEDLENLYDLTVSFIKDESGFGYYRYRALEFLKGEHKNKYQNAELTSRALAGIMKTLLIKRMDSSFFAFKASLSRFVTATEAMVKMFDSDNIIIAPKLKVTEMIMEDREDELIELVEQLRQNDENVALYKRKDFADGFYENLQDDLIKLKLINEQWQNVKADPKMDEFLEKLYKTFFDKEKNPGQKLVIFSESKETTSYLLNNLQKIGRKDVLEVNAGNRNQLKDAIKKNFDANIPVNEYRNEYNIIITTEVLAEGVNLHRSNSIVNYDTPWNSTRLMQRIGRVNRIGSVAPKVYIYNFFPTSNVNKDIDLEKRALMKLQAFHSALGEDSQIYSQDEETQSFGLFDKDMDEEKDVRLEFLMELRKFKADNPEWYAKIAKLPLKSRVGRKNKSLKESTFCYLRKANKNEFYHIPKGKEPISISFVEMANTYRATQSEKAAPLHKFHHEQVNAAIAKFKNLMLINKTSDTVINHKAGPRETSALNYLEGFLSLPLLSEEQKKIIKTAKEVISKGTYQNLTRDINKCAKDKSKSLQEKINNIFSIIGNYDITVTEDSVTPLIKIISKDSLKPEIVISESFID